MEKIDNGGITSALGFLASAVGCGIKDPNNKRLDLTLIHSTQPTVSASFFTINKVKAAPVRINEANSTDQHFRTILANSGNANACTGQVGKKDATECAHQIATLLNISPHEVALCSTGVIGIPLPMGRITPNFKSLVDRLNKTQGSLTAQAIMTSDTQSKELAVVVEIAGKKITIGGCAKGAGMINPNMATMLCFITTDANISSDALKFASKNALEKSFNRITIDGDMSTNDSVICLANGAAENNTIELNSTEAHIFTTALQSVMHDLAKMMVKDGERVTKCVQVKVKNALKTCDAKKIAEAVSNSALVKSSWNGNDPNWGRIIHAVGYSGADLDEEKIDIYLNDAIACQNGLQSSTPIEDLQKIVTAKEFNVTIDLKLGESDYWMYSSDLSPEYIDFNRSEYAYWKQGRLDGTVKG